MAGKMMLLSAVCAGLLLMSCGKDDNPASPGGGGGNTTPTEETMVMPYTISGDTLTIYQPQQIRSHKECNGSTLVTEYDTSDADTMVMGFYVSGDTMGIIDTSGIMILLRVGTGTGVIGTWVPADSTSEMPDKLVINATTVTAYGGGGDDCPADEYMQYWWPNYSGNFNGTIVMPSCTQVRITGGVTGEVVTITWDASGNMTYTSSNTSRTAYTYLENPTSCPNNSEPSWFWASPGGFMTQN